MIVGPVRSTAVEIPGDPLIHAHVFERDRGTRVAPGILLVHGFSPTGEQYGDLAAAAENLAGSGFTVLTPTITHLTRYVVDEQDVQMIGRSAEWLAQRTGAPVTAIGISFSGGLTLVAAARAEFRPSFRQVLALAPYDDLQRISRFYLTGYEGKPGGGEVKQEQLNTIAVPITTLHFIKYLVPPEDVAPVTSTVQQSIMLKQTEQPYGPEVLSGLTPRQKDEVMSIMGESPESKAWVMKALDQHGSDLESLSPRGQMGGLTATVTVMTGENDPAIPSLESSWLERDLPRANICKIYFSPVITHVTLTSLHPEKGLERLRRWSYKVALLHALAPAMETADPHPGFPGCPVVSAN